MQRCTLYGAALVICGLAAYSNCFQGEFFFDDNGTIIGNPYITQLWPLTDALKAPRRTTNTGRPTACLSLAVNYQFSGKSVAGFRTGNLLLHLLSGLLLYGIVRRTLASGNGIPPALKENADGIGFAAALAWTLHPVNGVLVNYIGQRCEVLMAFFYLLTLYCAIRSWQPDSRRGAWRIAAVLACICAMGSKEVAVGAPILILLYERTFIAGSFREAFRRSAPLHAALAATWLLLAGLLLTGGTAEGARVSRLPFSAWEYFLSQPRSILRYLQITFVPLGLSFDYGWNPAKNISEVWPSVLIVSALGIATLVAMFRRPAIGFLGAWFFVTLAPTSSVMPLPDIAVEYRTYLAMAAVLTAVFCGGAWLMGRWGSLAPSRAIAAGASVACIGVALGVLTFQRNEVYRSAAGLWLDVVRKHPENPRGHGNLGVALGERGQTDLAIAAMTRSVQLYPTNTDILVNLGALLARTGKREAALQYFESAVKFGSDNEQAAYNLANLYSETGRQQEAAKHYTDALRIKPDFVDAHLNYGIDLFNAKKFAEAESHFVEVVRLNPAHPHGAMMLSRTLNAAGRREDAIKILNEALAKNPGLEAARQELARLTNGTAN